MPGIESYRYDAQGRRTVIDSNGQQRLAIYDHDGRLLMNLDPGLATGCNPANDRVFCNSFEKPPVTVAQTRYVYLGRHLIGKDGIDGLRYLHTDALGSLVAETDASKNVTQRYHYEPYGAAFGQGPNGPGYTGAVMDPSGLTYMQARYYDPQLGRFLSTDPLDPDPMTGMGFNRYAYANSNPYRYYDPSGRWVCSGTDGDCDTFEEGLNLVNDASTSSNLTDEEQDALSAVVDFYGVKGDDTVSVAISEDSDVIRGTAALRADGGEDISLKPDGELGVLARNIVHEGQHGVDDQMRGRDITSRSERKATEVDAYTAQATFQKAIHFATSSSDGWTPFGGFSIDNINRQAEASVLAACGKSSTGSCGD